MHPKCQARLPLTIASVEAFLSASDPFGTQKSSAHKAMSHAQKGGKKLGCKMNLQNRSDNKAHVLQSFCCLCTALPNPDLTMLFLLKKFYFLFMQLSGCVCVCVCVNDFLHRSYDKNCLDFRGPQGVQHHFRQTK